MNIFRQSFPRYCHGHSTHCFLRNGVFPSRYFISQKQNEYEGEPRVKLHLKEKYDEETDTRTFVLTDSKFNEIGDDKFIKDEDNKKNKKNDAPEILNEAKQRYNRAQYRRYYLKQFHYRKQLLLGKLEKEKKEREKSFEQVQEYRHVPFLDSNSNDKKKKLDQADFHLPENITNTSALLIDSQTEKFDETESEFSGNFDNLDNEDSIDSRKNKKEKGKKKQKKTIANGK